MLNQASGGRCCRRNNVAASPQMCIAVTEHWPCERCLQELHGTPRAGGSTLHYLNIHRHRTLCQHLWLKDRKLSAKSWWEQGEAGSGKVLGGPNSTPALPWPFFTPSTPKAHFPSETPHPLEWKSLQESTAGDSYASLYAPAWGRGKFLLLIIVTQLWQPASPKRSPGKKSKLLKEFQTVQQRSVDRAYQCQLLSCRGNKQALPPGKSFSSSCGFQRI